jgi:hypothetical protein
LLCPFSTWTNKLLESTDKASVQINVGQIDPVTGRFTGDVTPIAISGYVRDHVSLRSRHSFLF